MARLVFRFTPRDTAEFDVCSDLPEPEAPALLEPESVAPGASDAGKGALPAEG